MKKWLFLFTISVCKCTFGVPIQDHTINREALSELTYGLGIPKDTDIVIETQKRWLRKPDQERWEMRELSSDQRLFVLNWAMEQGLFTRWQPSCNTYDKALVLGGTTSRMQLRLDHLKLLWEEGVRFDEIVWLTGDRPLDKQVDGLTDRCSTESDAAHIVWEEANLPSEMRCLPVIFIAAPMKLEGGFQKRPNREDTLLAWLKVSPTPCKALFVCNQPFCGDQFAIIKTTLPGSFLFDVVGAGVEPISYPSAAVTLDAIARQIYQEAL